MTAARIHWHAYSHQKGWTNHQNPKEHKNPDSSARPHSHPELVHDHQGTPGYKHRWDGASSSIQGFRDLRHVGYGGLAGEEKLVKILRGDREDLTRRCQGQSGRMSLGTWDLTLM